jgi:hypothetical protein
MFIKINNFMAINKEGSMANLVEKIDRMRKNLLWGVLLGTLLSFVFLIYPVFSLLFHYDRRVITFMKYRLFEGALVLWLLTILVFGIRFCSYKLKLKKNPALQIAVNDERIKMNWLKAYRFSFMIAVGITMIYLGIHIYFSAELLQLKWTLPNGPFLVLWAMIISLSGSFLYYNREADHE